MRTLCLALLLLPAVAAAKKPNKAPMPPPANGAVVAFYQAVDALRLDVPMADDVVGYTLDAEGGPLNVSGPSGVAQVQALLTGWGEDQGTIASSIDRLSCSGDAQIAVCAAEVGQTFTWKGEPAGGAQVRATFAFRAEGGRWVLTHWHESAPSAPPPADPAGDAAPEGATPPPSGG